MPSGIQEGMNVRGSHGRIGAIKVIHRATYYFCGDYRYGFGYLPLMLITTVMWSARDFSTNQ